jgi:hypothetical protein
MADIAISGDDFEALVQPLLGLRVSLPWKGYGSAIFLELGELVSLKSNRRRHDNGEACISVTWDWRVEAETAVLYGSSNSRPEIDAGIQTLKGTTVEAIGVVGQVPELVVRFSNGHCLRSMVMVTGNPEWAIRLTDDSWINAKRGLLLIGDEGSSLTEDEVAAFALAKDAADRWGVPSIGTKQGSCAGCTYFISLDGDADLLDYGCCIAAAGPFDGRAVERNSCCPSFTTNE